MRSHGRSFSSLAHSLTVIITAHADVKHPGTVRICIILQGSQIMENELFNLREELTQARVKLASWEDHWRQAKQVCDAWKHEAEDANNRAALACQERDQLKREQEQVSCCYYKQK